ncbi:MAG: helix-turn-helix transcriptional regulator [Dehalococcoidia bacterium]|nr:helix-turn-helix transcriptional regulator [Dehalococcoidia bacterium]
MERPADLLSALGSDTRIKLLRELAERPLCVGMLAMRLGITQSAVSQHLTVLRNAGLVQSDKRGSYVHYSLTNDARERCLAALDEVLPVAHRREDRQ